MTNQTEVSQVQNEVVIVSQKLLSGTLGIVEGARQITCLAHRLAADQDPDFTTFIGIESETDHLPLGGVRRHWAADALRKKDEELRAFEEFFRADASRACQNLILKFGTPTA